MKNNFIPHSLKINTNKEENDNIENHNYNNISIDNIINKLLSVKNTKKKVVQLTIEEIKYLIFTSIEIFKSQPVFLELESPINVCGDIHGQYSDLLSLFNMGGYPPLSHYLFLGDYVDRGKNSIETICLLLSYKIKYPERFFLLRGNHECASINKIYGFFDECKKRYNIKLWKNFVECFNYLPISAIIEDKIILMHGGLSPELKDMNQLNEIVRPTDVPDQGILCDLLWSDPESHKNGWKENDRGVSYTFNEKVIHCFLDENNLDLLCRAHQVVQDGYEFFADNTCLTIFSAPNYCGEFDNSAALLIIDENLLCSFKILKGKTDEDVENN